jgi:hypothetical protein
VVCASDDQADHAPSCEGAEPNGNAVEIDRWIVGYFDTGLDWATGRLGDWATGAECAFMVWEGACVELGG